MPVAVWWVLAIVAMLGMFAACAAAVAAGLRLMENALARRRERRSP